MALLQTVLNAATAGSTVYLAGEYTDAATLSKRLTLTVRPGEKAILRKDLSITGSATGFVIDGGGRNAWRAGRLVTVDPPRLVSDVNYSVNTASIYPYGSLAGKILGVEITRAGQQTIYSDATGGLEIAHCHIHDNGRDTGSSGHHGLYTAKGPHDIHHNLILRSKAFGVQLAGYSAQRNTHVWRNWIEGGNWYGITTYSGVYDGLFEENYVAGFVQGLCNHGGGAASGNRYLNNYGDRGWPTQVAGATFAGNRTGLPSWDEAGTTPPPDPPPPPEEPPEEPPDDPCQTYKDKLGAIRGIVDSGIAAKTKVARVRGVLNSIVAHAYPGFIYPANVYPGGTDG